MNSRSRPGPLLLAALLTGLGGPGHGAEGPPTLRILIQTSPLAGAQYYAANRVWDQLRPGDRLTLAREGENPHDSRAIRVAWHGVQLGYLPRLENDAVADAMDRHAPLEARISRLRPDSDPWRRVEVQVFLVIRRSVLE
ncbi:HIRAN domain-containing protein [Azospira inquinata]|uniref:HIRAN domain-containing protein n=1 Tax=Azospira inquinata TaxID=2785627 RepID=A0A975SP40_9RHOO|nr:HIRAN domain-containing protein [Azospira inquinata]QWT47536.1 HIRAN domain-containing protein [Azospira inquinata]QWT49838.1 HIRAN domain-containing protein [Azospira inquinata]